MKIMVVGDGEGEEKKKENSELEGRSSVCLEMKLRDAKVP